MMAADGTGKPPTAGSGTVAIGATEAVASPPSATAVLSSYPTPQPGSAMASPRAVARAATRADGLCSECKESTVD